MLSIVMLQVSLMSPTEEGAYKKKDFQRTKDDDLDLFLSKKSQDKGVRLAATKDPEPTKSPEGDPEPKDDVPKELNRLEAAVETLRSDLYILLERGEVADGGEHRDVIEAYRMFAADRGWLDWNKVLIETLTGFKRAGCDGILTYFALEAAKLLKA